MMRFKIQVRPGSKISGVSTSGSSVLADIYINEFVEELQIPISYWSLEDYYAQWKDGASRILEDTATSKSAIFTEVHDIMSLEQSIMYWALYRYGEVVYVQNCVVPISSIEKANSINRTILYDLVLDFEKEGASTWELTIEDVMRFHKSIQVKD